MKKLILAAGLACAVGLPGTANAATCTLSLGGVEQCFFLPDSVDPTSPFKVTFNGDGTISSDIGRNGIGSPSDPYIVPAGTAIGTPSSPLSFEDTYFFTVDQDGFGSGSVATSASGATAALAFQSTTDLDFTSITVNGTPLTVFLTPPAGATPGLAESASALFVPVNAGPGGNTIVISGIARGNGSYGGNATFTPTVPEPATWAMMLFGFGAVGFGMRRRPKQAVRVRFAA